MSWSTRLVGLFPAEFRRQFGADLAEQLEADYRRAAAAGRWTGWRFAVATAWDLVLGALAERWRPSPQLDPGGAGERKGGATMLDGWKGDLRLALRSLLSVPRLGASREWW
jgi:hypothetical protein